MVDNVCNLSVPEDKAGRLGLGGQPSNIARPGTQETKFLY